MTYPDTEKELELRANGKNKVRDVAEKDENEQAKIESGTKGDWYNSKNWKHSDDESLFM